MWRIKMEGELGVAMHSIPTEKWREFLVHTWLIQEFSKQERQLSRMANNAATNLFKAKRLPKNDPV